MKRPQCSLIFAAGLLWAPMCDDGPDGGVGQQEQGQGPPRPGDSDSTCLGAQVFSPFSCGEPVEFGQALL